MLKDLQEIYEEITGDYETQITADMVIDDELNLPSIGKIQLIYAIEDKFNIEIPSKEIRQFVKVEDIVIFLNKNVD